MSDDRAKMFSSLTDAMPYYEMGWTPAGMVRSEGHVWLRLRWPFTGAPQHPPADSPSHVMAGA